jgi:hypothetical protein
MAPAKVLSRALGDSGERLVNAKERVREVMVQVHSAFRIEGRGQEIGRV